MESTTEDILSKWFWSKKYTTRGESVEAEHNLEHNFKGFVESWEAEEGFKITGISKTIYEEPEIGIVHFRTGAFNATMNEDVAEIGFQTVVTYYKDNLQPVHIVADFAIYEYDPATKKQKKLYEHRYDRIHEPGDCFEAGTAVKLFDIFDYQEGPNEKKYLAKFTDFRVRYL